MPDFYSQLDQENPTTDFKAALLELFDTMLGVDTLTAEQRSQLARVRAKVAIELTDF